MQLNLIVLQNSMDEVVARDPRGLRQNSQESQRSHLRQDGTPCPHQAAGNQR